MSRSTFFIGSFALLIGATSTVGIACSTSSTTTTTSVNATSAEPCNIHITASDEGDDAGACPSGMQCKDGVCVDVDNDDAGLAGDAISAACAACPIGSQCEDNGVCKPHVGQK